MNKNQKEADFGYAMYTSLTGTRPFQGVQLILENSVKNFKTISCHSDGSFSHTYDIVTRNAISDISIIMAYSLLEGYFFEECKYYLNKSARTPVEAINELCDFHNIVIDNWTKRSQIIEAVRNLRNKVAHQNSAFLGEVDKKHYNELFGEDIFEGRRYPRLSLALSISLVEDFEEIAREYAGLVLSKPR